MAAAACQTAPRPPRPPAPELVRRSQPLLGTFVVISAVGPAGADRAQVNAAISAAFAEIRRIDALMSLHRADSELQRVNATAAAGPVAVSADLFRVLTAAMEIAAATDGGFDITVEPLTQLWGFIWKEYRLPTPAELAAVLPRVDYRHLELTPATQTVRFKREGVRLDLGGIAKGYAVDCALEKLRALGITNAMVRAGGDLRVLGHPPDADAWTVQLEDPAKTGRRVTIQLRDAAISTSGNYENYFEIAGRRYSHIVDPRTGLPAEGLAACSVIAPTCLESDGLATGVFVLGPERSLARLGSRYGLRFVLPRAGGRFTEQASALFPATVRE